MAFIQYEDYRPQIHEEILNVILRDDEEILTLAEERAIGEMKSYLSARYDTEQIFNKTGKERNSVVLMFAIDMVIYHLHCAHNPQKMADIRVKRYERAISWLKGVQALNINPDLPLLQPREETAYVLTSSNRKRNNYF
ncbi:DUF1320 domain-containing protein [Bacteroidales bacterium OttesenSCG-928-C19]|nr:DUF1320 domain-containing protein [Bacteroidales bacterium OttesenSCG-928-C19]